MLAESGRCVAFEAFFAGVVTNDEPGQDANSEDHGRRCQRGSAPSEILDAETQRDLGEQCAEISEEETESRHARESAAREPMRGEAQDYQPTYGCGSTNDRAAQTGEGETAGGSEEELSESRGDGAPDQQFPWPPGISQGSDRNLHCGVKVKIKRREVSQAGRADTKIAHQFRGHNRGGRAQKEDREIEKRPDSPDDPRKPCSRIRPGSRVSCRSGRCH